MASQVDVNTGQLRVSSVLNRDTKQFGKKHLVDNDDDTCWNSDQGSPQWISVDFENSLILDEFHIQFQGGFVGRDCWVEMKRSKDGEWEKMFDFYPKDINSLQIFKAENNSEPISSMKIIFNNSTDFFGRITIYRLEIFRTDS
ncbi:Nuclear receptor 2C2-associated protein [Mactra antiquata]